MSTWLLPLVVAGLALGGVPVARWLRWVSYRKPDEEDLPLPGKRWWVPPWLAVAGGLLTWRVVLSDPARGVGEVVDPGVGSGREGWVQLVLLLTLLAVMLACVCLAAMDMDVHRLPDRIMWPTMGVLTVGLLLAGLLGGGLLPWVWALLAGLLCGLAYLLLALTSLARGSLAIGLGDVKLAALLGAGLGWFGWQPVVVGMYAGVLLGGVFALVLLVLRRVTFGGHLPYGPPMMIGALVGAVLPPDVLSGLF